MTNLKAGQISEDARQVVKAIISGGSIPSFGNSSYQKALKAFAEDIQAKFEARYPNSCAWHGP